MSRILIERTRGARRQAGVGGGAILVALILIGVAVLLARGLSRTDAASQGERITRDNLQRASDALVRFAAENRRLPCPAAGTDDAGIAAPAAAAATCTEMGGVVPWQTIGLRREESVDGWGRKISYRAFSGATGLTQTDGASAVECNSAITVSMGPVGTDGRCRTSHVNVYNDFLAGKGLTVSVQATVRTSIAFVLISHGETGYGAFTAEGGGRVVMPTGGGRESSNTGTATPFFADAHSAAGLAPADVNHFDDVVAYRTVDEVVTSTKLIARAYETDPGTVSSGTFTRANISAAVGVAVGNNTGLDTVDFGNFSISTGLGGRNVSSGVLGSGEGIGTILDGGTTSAATTLSSAAGEFLRINFDTQGRSLGMTIVDISRLSASNSERVRFTFYLGGSTIATITKDQCTLGNVQANYSLDPGGLFDRVDVASISTTFGGTSTILLGSLRSCSADVTPSLCVAPTAAVANNCP